MLILILLILLNDQQYNNAINMEVLKKLKTHFLTNILTVFGNSKFPIHLDWESVGIFLIK